MATTAKTHQLTAKQRDKVLEYCKKLYDKFSGSNDLRLKLLNIDFAYMREPNTGGDNTRARAAHRYGDRSRIPDVTVPVVMPQVESGVTYLSRVFLSGNPIFGVVSNKAKNDNAAAMYDAIMEDNSIRGGWIRQFNLFFRDGLKYNYHGLEVNWVAEKVYTPVTDVEFSTTEAKPKEVIWQGNKIRRLDMYNTFWDASVPPAEVHLRGEYAGYLELHSSIAFEQFLVDNDDIVITEAVEAARACGKDTADVATNYFVPPLAPVGTSNMESDGIFNAADWLTNYMNTGERAKGSYEFQWVYARIIPADFELDVPAASQPQIWRFLVVNQKEVLVAEQQTNAHNYLNIIIGQPLEDGLNYQTKSYAENAIPMQEAATALMNATLHSKRRQQFDRLLYNPSLIRKEDINSSNPIARIPVKASAYTKSLSEAVYAFPYNDNSGNMLQELGLVVNLADKLQGINAAQQGQFTKGNRTKHEYDDIMSNSDGRLQTIAMFIEAQTMVPLKEMLKLNIMQYAQAGTIYSRESREVIKIDQVALRTAAIEFKVADGYLPSDKLISAETMQIAIQAAVPGTALAQRVDIGGLFIHYLKTQGAKDLDQFLIPMQPQQGVPTDGTNT